MLNQINIIIVNYNCWKYTIACISSLLKSTNTNFNIFIVDNQSTDNSIQKIEEWCKSKQLTSTTISDKKEEIKRYLQLQKPLITIVKSNHNNGFGAGNNIILKPLTEILSDDYVWLLNPDTEVEPKVLEDMSHLVKDKKKILIGNVIHFFNAKDKIMYCGGFKVKKYTHGVVDIKKQEDIKNIDAVAGASIFTHISTFKDLGVFQEDYFMYWEETDFCAQAKKQGYIFDVNTKSKIFDHVGATSKSNFLREYLYLLNGLKFYKKYYPKRLILIVLSTIAKLIKTLLFGDKIKLKAIYYAHIDFYKTLRGKSVDVKSRIKANT